MCRSSLRKASQRDNAWRSGKGRTEEQRSSTRHQQQLWRAKAKEAHACYLQL